MPDAVCKSPGNGDDEKPGKSGLVGGPDEHQDNPQPTHEASQHKDEDPVTFLHQQHKDCASYWVAGTEGRNGVSYHVDTQGTGDVGLG